MIRFILNDQEICSDLSPGTTVLDLVRYHQNLKGTKIGCREGDCGACTILVGELVDKDIRYRTMTSCLMPLANAAGKHIVTIEGINPEDGSLTPVQQSLVDESGTQCGFCTVGFVMSLTGFCIDETEKTTEMAVSAVDGNICRCTGYKSIERAANRVLERLARSGRGNVVPDYFVAIADSLRQIRNDDGEHKRSDEPFFVGGGTDVYVQRPDVLPGIEASHLFYDEKLRSISESGEYVELGASVTVTDLLESSVMQSTFRDLYKHLKLVSSTPIRNMATLAGNFINASPIGDMTIWFLALNAEIVLNTGRSMLLRQLFLDYKKLKKKDNEFITGIRFRKPVSDVRFNFEKVCKRTYLDIATVNTAASFKIEPLPGTKWVPPALQSDDTEHRPDPLEYFITDAHIAAGGVAPIPLYLKETSSFLIGRYVNEETIKKASDIVQAEISPISDVRGSEDYKRLLMRQLFRAHFVELFRI